MRRGFTLLETVVVVALLSLLVSMAATGFHEIIPRYRLERAVWEIRSVMSVARVRAMLDTASYRVRFEGGELALERYDEAAKIWTRRDWRALDGVRTEANNSPIFTPQGTVTGLATIDVSNERGAYRITMAITGRVRAVRL